MVGIEIAIKHLKHARTLIDNALALIDTCSHISDGSIYFIDQSKDNFIEGERVYKCRLCLEIYK
jgi:hypothetical protein